MVRLRTKMACLNVLSAMNLDMHSFSLGETIADYSIVVDIKLLRFP